MTRSTCPKCGATLLAPGATCRRCLFDLALGDETEESGAQDSHGPRRASTPPPEPAELAPLFPELEIEVRIGAGGMGAVYRARQKRLGRAVALKVLHAELARDPVFVERFLREAQALARLAHPGIVTVHDYGEREGRCFLVMEHVEGANLRTLLKQGLLAPRQTLDIVRQLCDALQFAHDEGIVHRDIKPENVLVDRSGRVKIADFGLAKLVGQPASATLTDAGQVMGTPHYMAPEQLERPRDVDHRADLFSLGVVFYEMLTGELPLGRFAPPSKRVEVDVRLDEIVLRSLEHERERRYQSAGEVRTDVEAVAHGERPRKDGSRLEGALGEEAGEEPKVIGWKLDLTTEHPTAWGWLVILCVCWILAGVAFNHSKEMLTLAGILLTWVFFALVRRRAGLEEEETTSWRWSRGHTAFFLVAFGMLSVFAGLVASFEKWSWHYSASLQAPAEGLDLGWRANDGLLERVGVKRVGSSAVVEIDSGHTLDNPWCRLPGPVYLAAWVLLFGGATLVLRGRGLRNLRTELPEVGRILGLWLGSLLLVHLALQGLHGFEHTRVQVGSAASCSGSADDLARSVYAELIERGYAVHAEFHGRLVDVPSGSDLAELCVLKAAPESPLERWRLTWTGPRRLEPHLVVRIVSDLRGERAAIVVDAGMVERQGSEEREWRAWLEQLLDQASTTTRGG